MLDITLEANPLTFDGSEMRIWWKKMGRISRCFQYTTNLKLQLHPRQTKTSQSGYYKIYIRIHPVSATEFLLHKRPEVSRR